jgi:hypothetical protein
VNADQQRDQLGRFDRFPIVMTQAVNVKGGGTDFTEVWRTENMERARRGHVTFGFLATFDDVARTFSNLFLEVNVVGYVGNTGTVVMYTTIDVNSLGEFSWEDPETYTALSFETRQNIDGVNTPSGVGIVTSVFSVQGSYWR